MPFNSGLRYLAPSPLGALAVAQHRVNEPRATVVAIHGGLDRGSSFSRLSRRLFDFDVVSYDRRGYQRSRLLGAGTLADHVADLGNVIAGVRDSAPVILFGHSFGGLVALALCAQRVDIAQLVVAYETPLPWILERDAPAEATVPNAALEAEMFFRRVVSDASWERLGPLERESRQLDGLALCADLDEMSSSRTPFDVEEIRVPVRYLYGDLGGHGYYRELAHLLEATNPHFSTREIPGARHGAHLSHPDVVASEVRSAFEQLHGNWDPSLQ